LSTTETNTDTAVSNPCQREISIEIPAPVVAEQEKKIVANYQKHARIPGFRTGKTPATIVKRRFDEDIKKDLIEALIPKFFREETQKQNLAPVSQPQVTHLELNDGEPLKFTATFEVMPELDISGYKEIKVERPAPSVTDEEVEATLKNIQEQQAKYTDVEGESALQDGDYAVVSFKGTGTEEGAQPIEVKEVLVGIGLENTVKEFTENLRGAKPGEEKSFDVTYAPDFAEQRLAGKTIHYDVQVKGIRQKELPELNDEFAKSMNTEITGMDDLRKRIREELLHEKEHKAEHEAKDKIMEELIKRYEFPVPSSLVEHQIDQRVDRGFRALTAQGFRAEQLKGVDFGRVREGQREGAVREVKTSLLLEKIADAEQIEVSDDEMNQEINALALQMQQPPEAVRTRLEQSGGLDNIRYRLRQDKALTLLYQQSA
jgi:trigger factor